MKEDSEVPISAMRRDYRPKGLEKEQLHSDPVEQFRLWFQEAIEADLLEPNAMSLATAGTDGRPGLRTVLLKAFDTRGFVFFTNYKSRKARQISENPQATLLFPWLPLERQVIISGPVQRISTAESFAYFASRPFGSRIGAWVSMQSKIISSRKLLEMKLEELKQKFADGEVPLPDFWGGYRVEPESFEFWQGSPNRLHDRFVYSKDPEGRWEIHRLSP